MININKTQAVFLAVIVISGLAYSYLYYSGHFTQIKDKEKTTEEIGQLKEKAKVMSLAGELDSFAGEITKIENDRIFVRAISSVTDNLKNGEEATIKITKDTLIRKIEFPEIPEGVTDPVSAKETIVALSYLKVGDTVIIDAKKDGAAVVIDIMNDNAPKNKNSDQPIGDQATGTESSIKSVKSFSGIITKIDNKELIVKITTESDPQYGKEISVVIMDNTLVKKIEVPYTPKGSTETSSSKYTDINLADLKSGDKIYIDINVVGESNEAFLINLIK